MGKDHVDAKSAMNIKMVLHRDGWVKVVLSEGFLNVTAYNVGTFRSTEKLLRELH